jgi:exodeoxyribonuclease VII small subunit
LSKVPEFEGDLKRLEELVRKMEEDELSLEESLAAFEEGMKLAGRLAKALEKAQERVMKLTEGRGGDHPQIERFEDDEGEDD